MGHTPSPIPYIFYDTAHVRIALILVASSHARPNKACLKFACSALRRILIFTLQIAKMTGVVIVKQPMKERNDRIRSWTRKSLSSPVAGSSKLDVAWQGVRLPYIYLRCISVYSSVLLDVDGNDATSGLRNNFK